MNAFEGPGTGYFVPRVEIVVDLRVELFAYVGRAEAKPILATPRAADPAVTGCIETFADFIVVHSRHYAENLRNVTGRIEASAIGVPGRALNDRVGTVRARWSVG